jgi:hypothetical protein
VNALPGLSLRDAIRVVTIVAGAWGDAAGGFTR